MDDRSRIPPSSRATEIPVPAAATRRLSRPVQVGQDHILGPLNAPITLVEYGSYACPHCRAANERITEVRAQLGDRLRYVLRHRPLTGSDLAQPAAEIAESAANHEQFWDGHVTLMTRSDTLTESDLNAVAETLGVTQQDDETVRKTSERAKRRGWR